MADDQHMGVDFAKALAGVTSLGAGLAVLAGATGAFEGMQRNNPQWTAFVFSAAVVAGVLVLAAGWTNGKPITVPVGRLGIGARDKTVTANAETLLGVLGLAIFLPAALGGIILLVKARGERPPPSIKVAFKGDSKIAIAGSIKAELMTADETLKIRVVANKSADNTATGILAEDRLFDARMGPDASGAVDLPLDVPIPTKKYEWVNVLAWISDKPDACFGLRTNSKNTPGCVAIRLPDAAAAG